MSKFFDYIKGLFFILLALQLLPALIKSFKSQYSDLINTKTKIGVINIKDALYEGDKYIKDLKDYFEDDAIKAIVLKINSPGGAAGTSQAIFNEIKNLQIKHKKYVVAFVENIAASGGYYIATASDYIISTPSALIGSIGSYIAHPVFKHFIEQYKIKYEVIKSGDYKTVGNPFLEDTEPQKQMLQELSDNIYKQFVKDVATQRSKLSKNYNEWANGKIYSGEQALHLGLIDQLGSQSDISNALIKQAKLEGPFQWVTPKKKMNVLRMLLNPDEESNTGLISNIISQIISVYQKDALSIKY